MQKKENQEINACYKKKNWLRREEEERDRQTDDKKGEKVLRKKQKREYIFTNPLPHNINF